MSFEARQAPAEAEVGTAPGGADGDVARAVGGGAAVAAVGRPDGGASAPSIEFAYRPPLPDPSAASSSSSSDGLDSYSTLVFRSRHFLSAPASVDSFSAESATSLGYCSDRPWSDGYRSEGSDRSRGQRDLPPLYDEILADAAAGAAGAAAAEELAASTVPGGPGNPAFPGLFPPPPSETGDFCAAASRGFVLRLQSAAAGVRALNVLAGDPRAAGAVRGFAGPLHEVRLALAHAAALNARRFYGAPFSRIEEVAVDFPRPAIRCLCAVRHLVPLILKFPALTRLKVRIRQLKPPDGPAATFFDARSPHAEVLRRQLGSLDARRSLRGEAAAAAAGDRCFWFETAPRRKRDRAAGVVDACLRALLQHRGLQGAKGEVDDVVDLRKLRE